MKPQATTEYEHGGRQQSVYGPANVERKTLESWFLRREIGSLAPKIVVVAEKVTGQP